MVSGVSAMALLLLLDRSVFVSGMLLDAANRIHQLLGNSPLVDAFGWY
jgi:hypothetical protein